MPDRATMNETAANDLGEYCRQIEAHLSRVNAGNLVRVFGPAFELVRAWHDAAVPLSVVFRGIEQKAERHHAGQSKRPLRLEFCRADVESLFADWRRAVGVQRDAAPRGAALEGEREGETPGEEPRKPSISRQLDRAIQKLSLTTGRLEAPPEVQAETSRILDELSALRDTSKRARGDARHAAIDRARALDADLGRLARLSGQDVLGEVGDEAAAELAPFRGRLSPAQWQHALDANVDRLLRARYGLPTLDLDDAS